MTNIDRSVVGIVCGAGIVAPCRVPIAAVPKVPTAGDQLDSSITRSIPTLIVPFRMIRTEYFVLRTLPALAAFDPIVRVECHGRSNIWFRLGFETSVLLFDLLNLLCLHLLAASANRALGRSCACSGWTSGGCCARSWRHTRRGSCSCSGAGRPCGGICACGSPRCWGRRCFFPFLPRLNRFSS